MFNVVCPSTMGHRAILEKLPKSDSLLIKLPKIECHGQKGSRGFVHGVAEPGPAAERCDTCCDVHRARLSYTSGLTFFLSYSVLLGCFVLYTLGARSKV
jgi:hypothetical protein